VKLESLEFKFRKKSSAIDLNSVDNKGDNRFRRFEYWGIGSYFMLHHVGDDTLYQGFSHRNRKNDTSKPFVRSAPHRLHNYSNLNKTGSYAYYFKL